MTTKRSAVAQIRHHVDTRPEAAGHRPRSSESRIPFVAECIDARHPVLQGRARVRWRSETGAVQDLWAPTLRGVVVREGDRVLLLPATNEAEPIVVGVVDGFARRSEPVRNEGPIVELKADEVFRVVTEQGVSLLEIVRNADGPVVRLMQNDAQIEIPGKLLIKASEIELRAERGPVRIDANDDVIVTAEMIRLN
jgi:hypothetical protein